MKKWSKILPALVLWVAITANLYAQNQRKTTPVKLNKNQYNAIDPDVSPFRKPLNVAGAMSNANPNKTSVISFKALGSAVNAYTALGSNRHRIAASNALNTVVHAHRASATTGGGGRIRIDVSTNAGSTFTNDILIYDNLASSSIGNGRYPQIVIHNPAGNTNPANAFASGLGALTDGAGWKGYGFYTAKFDGSLQSESAQANNHLIAQSLHEANGTYWAIDYDTDPSNDNISEDTLVVWKGTWNSTTNRIDWVINNKLKMGATASIDTPGDHMYQDVCIAFAPNGMVGYIMVRGDLQATHPSNTCAPILWKTTDGGNTWSLINFDMGSMNIPNVTSQLLVDPERGSPVNFFYTADITVDNSGKFHIVGSVAAAAGDGVDPDSTFYLYPNAGRYLVHIWGDNPSNIQGRLIDSLLSYTTVIGDGSEAEPPQDASRAQVARTEDGTKIFFVWGDDRDNVGKPDAWMQGFNTVTSMYTPVLPITDGTSRDNEAELLSIAPTVLGNTGCYEIPIVIGKCQSSSTSQTDFTYIDDAQICDAQFTLSSVGNSADLSQTVTLQAYPNPAAESVNFVYTLSNKANVELSVLALDGRIVSTLTKGNQGTGTYTYTFNRVDLPAGLYIARLVIDGTVSYTKIVLE
ncbi:MAG: T9SS type A sorting domain-containing protein [Bacteroidia bacterium]|nr:T9SS type A sorting domain-containing protein [Bacteroidia bacterium]MDW8301652.1 T9SS type A sorting domain-containing protein [Bacteroidia bacterium]